MLRYIRTDASCKHVPEMKKMGKKIWFMKNSEGLVPLQLAAKFGQDQIFKDIMEIPVSNFALILIRNSVNVKRLL